MLGVTFDSKLNWGHHISNCINKAKKSLFTLRLLRKFFNPLEMRTLLDSYFYSVLYYNAVIWLQPEIGCAMKQKLLSISACALRTCLMNNNNVRSFEKIHELNKKCTPIQIMSYQAALLLYKTINFEVPDFEAITVLNQMTGTSRQTSFIIFRNSSTRIGMNTTSNKFHQLTDKIYLNSLGLTFVHYKKLMKIRFLKFGNT